MPDNIQFHPATLPLLQAVLKNLREADKKEIEAHGLPVSLLALYQSVVLSRQSYVVTLNGTPVAACGYTFLGGTAQVWMVGSEDVVKKPVKTVRAIAETLSAWKKELGSHLVAMTATVWEGNKKHVKLLERLGFKTRKTLRSPGTGEVFKEMAVCA